MILELIDEAQASGARLKVSCQTVGLDERTIQRWRRRGGGDDLRAGPKSVPSNKISSSARKKVLEVANSEESVHNFVYGRYCWGISEPPPTAPLIGCAGASGAIGGSPKMQG